MTSMVVTMALVMLVIDDSGDGVSKKMCTHKNLTPSFYIVLTYTIIIDYIRRTVIVYYV